MAEPLTSRVYHLLNSYRWQIPSALLFFSGAYFIRKSFSKVDRPAVSEATLAETTAKCRFNISNDTSSTISLPDGRKLGYAEYGSRTGRAIFFLHGWPGSRIEAVHLDGLGKKLGARIISVDRPGFGWSSPQPERTMLDHPKDIDHLATHLKLDHYGVMVRARGTSDHICKDSLTLGLTGCIWRRTTRTCLRVCIASRQAQSRLDHRRIGTT